MSINIRSLQHYLYCPRRFGLLEINCDWGENAFVVKANLMHTHVHDGTHEYKSKNKIVKSSVAVYNDELDLYGITDCVEFERCAEGVEIHGLDGKYKVNIVEYKPSQPKNGEIRQADAIQIFAQKICADSVWNCDSQCFIYYSDTKKRVRMPFDTEYDSYYSLLENLLKEINICLETKTIPDRIKGQNCSGCSLKEACMPSVKKYNVKELILKEGRE